MCEGVSEGSVRGVCEGCRHEKPICAHASKTKGRLRCRNHIADKLANKKHQTTSRSQQTHTEMKLDAKD